MTYCFGHSALCVAASEQCTELSKRVHSAVTESLYKAQVPQHPMGWSSQHQANIAVFWLGSEEPSDFLPPENVSRTPNKNWLVLALLESSQQLSKFIFRVSICSPQKANIKSDEASACHCSGISGNGTCIFG